jgi:hypothetical protein
VNRIPYSFFWPLFSYPDGLTTYVKWEILLKKSKMLDYLIIDNVINIALQFNCKGGKKWKKLQH